MGWAPSGSAARFQWRWDHGHPGAQGSLIHPTITPSHSPPSPSCPLPPPPSLMTPHHPAPIVRIPHPAGQVLCPERHQHLLSPSSEPRESHGITAHCVDGKPEARRGGSLAPGATGPLPNLCSRTPGVSGQWFPIFQDGYRHPRKVKTQHGCDQDQSLWAEP